MTTGALGPTPQDEPLTGWRAILVAPLILLVRFYRRWISPALPATCRFYPTCSTYGLQALRRFGPIKGTWLTLRRLARCHPWNPGGVDHVPPRDSGSVSHAHVIAKDD